MQLVDQSKVAGISPWCLNPDDVVCIAYFGSTGVILLVFVEAVPRGVERTSAVLHKKMPYYIFCYFCNITPFASFP